MTKWSKRFTGFLSRLFSGRTPTPENEAALARLADLLCGETGTLKDVRRPSWNTLLDALEKKGRLVEIDHRADPVEMLGWLGDLAGIDRSELDRIAREVSEEPESESALDLLEMIAHDIAAPDRVLVNLYEPADTVAVTLIPEADLRTAVGLARASRMGKISKI